MEKRAGVCSLNYKPHRHVVRFPGFPQYQQVMLNLCDWRIINLVVDRERFSMFCGKVVEYRRELDLRRGLVIRSLVWESPDGKRVHIRTTRVVSMVRRHSAAIRYEVTALGFSGQIVFESMVKGKVRSQEIKGEHTELVKQGSEGDVYFFVYKTKTATFRIGMAFGHQLKNADKNSVAVDLEIKDNLLVNRFTIGISDGETLVFDKHACFYTNVEISAEDLVKNAIADVKKDIADGFESICLGQADFWKRYWDVADIEISGNVADQQAVRFSLFHLRQSHPEDERRSIGANGMTGDPHRGHIFWDTEMYIVPQFLYTQPELVRPLLMYRYGLLERARKRAVEMEGVGALFSWSSISGEECETIFEASTAQYHLLSDIAYAIWRYTKATDDTDFLYNYDAEILFETARFLSDRGKFIPLRENKFCINAVCGPDEYGCGVNNNCYTNMMVQWHLQFAGRVYDRMKKECPNQFAELAGRINLNLEERELWQRAADNMYIPFNQRLGIHEQDDSFLYLDPVDMSKLPRQVDIRFELHPLNLWCIQVVKQADVLLLLMFVLGDQFTLDIKQANYEFYEPCTIHGSSLLPSIHSIIVSEIDKADDAYGYFRRSAYTDLYTLKNNTAHGVHSACLGGTWMAIVNGFAGMRDYEGGLLFNPLVPDAWESYRFKVNYRGCLIGVDAKRDAVTYRLLSGKSISFHSSGKEIILSSSKPTEVCPII